MEQREYIYSYRITTGQGKAEEMKTKKKLKPEFTYDGQAYEEPRKYWFSI